ncbi:transposase [Roseicella sp. DB1501]|nr:transposase [Roseicella sp. DB1501]NOG72206.1 transposase [Roseicella sp. DB1501]
MGEVISVVARRRRWTPEQKLALVEEVSRPGVSVAAVADRHGMSRSLLFEWRRQVREGVMPGVVRAEAAPALVPVRLVDDAPQKEAPRPPPLAHGSAERPSKSAAMVEVVLSNGRVLRVSEAIRPEVLGRLAAALEA